MLLSKEVQFNGHKREALRYQPTFDLRKNVARVVAYYAPSAIQKGITLDIFVSPETPNYFQGNVSCFLVILSQLLQHSIELMRHGDLCIRIYHDSLHQSNSCATELSITVTANDPSQRKELTSGTKSARASNSADKKLSLKGPGALNRIKELCRYFDGNLTLQKKGAYMPRYIVTCVLQQTHHAEIFNFA